MKAADKSAERIFEAWRELRRGPVRYLRQDLYGAGPDALDPAQVDSLEVIVTAPRWRMSEFAQALHIDPSTATRMVNRLVDEGMVNRSVAPEDGRVVIISATKAAIDECERIASGRRQLVQEFLDDFNESEASELADLMERLTAGIARVVQDRYPERLPLTP